MSITKSKRLEVYNKYQGHCAYCGDKIIFKSMQPDHINPKWYYKANNLEGVDDIENLNPSCRYCNNYKGGLKLEEFRLSLLTMFNEKLQYLFKSKTKMKVAEKFGVVKITKWDGVFHFENE